MKIGLKRAALALAAGLVALGLGGCSLPMGGFADYDVSGYFQALLDSSYKNQNVNYMQVAAATEENAQQNNVTTVRNAAVNFCNTYGVSPSEEQLSQLEDVMRQALAQAVYTVKDEEKVEGGYHLEVEIDPIVNFSGLESQIAQLRTQAQDEADQANESSSRRGDSYDGDSDGYDGGYWDDGDGYSDGDGYDDGYGDGYSDGDGGSDSWDGSSQADGSEPAGQTVDANTLFVDKVVEYCQEQLGSLRHSGQTVAISLDIRQTEEGELQLDTNQLDTIDRTVLQFQS